MRCMIKKNPNVDLYLKAISIPFWHYYLLKYLDLLDTVFFVLRKKYNQITLLHVVHHAGFCLILNAALPHVHKAVAYYPLPAFTINAAIHVIMYTYYGLTAFGPSMQKYLWWKKYLTVLQINDRKAGGRAYRHSVAAEFGIDKSVVLCAWKAFQTTGTALRKVGGGRPRTTTAGEDRYIILQAKRDRRQSASVIAQQLSTAMGRQVSRFTVARRLRKGGLFSSRPERCLPLKVDHRRHHLQWRREHKNWTTDQWSRVLFTDESRFSTRSDPQRVLIWREIGTRFYTSNIKERHHYGGPRVLVWRGIMLNG
ncbi:elongation of very long chain fatty acids protein 4 [Trichonephila clavipes]|nr:elongation of very long chain fatty acids protein 4 [Trichonephila clavipes]